MSALLPHWTSVADLPRSHGAPLGRGTLRVQPADFQVEEQLGFVPDDDGEHLLLWVRKTATNTEWVARRLATLVGAPVSAIGYAGLKDRHAVTTQWFSVPRPREAQPDWTLLAADGIEVLAVHRHRRKLRRGALSGNRFQIVLRECTADAAALALRLDAIRQRGIPNYFGEQRFGHADGNLRRAHALFEGIAGRVSRHQRSLWLSAVRSQIFNAVLAERVRRDDWDQVQPGDCLQLAGTHSHFSIDEVDATLLARCAEMDVHPTGPLWGVGVLPTRGAVRTLEEQIAAEFPSWLSGLAAHDLVQERRALRVRVAELSGELAAETLTLRFELPAGAYATAVLRELVDWQETAAAALPE